MGYANPKLGIVTGVDTSRTFEWFVVMASRYLIVEFDDATQAETLKQRIDEASRAGKSYRVIGYFAKPSAPYCECNKEVTTRNQESSLKRGEKFGWWVCKDCRRPAMTISGLKNLIKPEDIIKPNLVKRGLHNLMFYIYTISAPTKAR